MHGLGDADVGLDAADERLVAPAEVEARRRAAAENDRLRQARRRRRAARATSATVSPSPRGYCSVTTIGTPSASAPRTRIAVRRGDVLEARRSPCGSASCTSTTTSAARSRSSRPPVTGASRLRRRGDRERALAVGDRAGGDRQQHAARAASRPGEAASSPSGSRSRPRRPPTRRRGRRGTRFAGSSGRDPRDRQPEQRAAARHPLDDQLEVEHAGQHELGVERRERRSRGRSTPIGACSNGTSFSSRACGAWSVAMQSIDAAAQRPRSAPGGRPRCAAAGSS